MNMQAADGFALQRDDVVYVVLDAITARYEVTQTIHGRDSSFHLFVEPRRRGALFAEPSFLCVGRLHPRMRIPPPLIFLTNVIAILCTVSETCGLRDFRMVFFELCAFAIAGVTIPRMVSARPRLHLLGVFLVSSLGALTGSILMLGIPRSCPCFRLFSMGGCVLPSPFSHNVWVRQTPFFLRLKYASLAGAMLAVLGSLYVIEICEQLACATFVARLAFLVHIE